jgi:hypothetical protein
MNRITSNLIIGNRYQVFVSGNFTLDKLKVRYDEQDTPRLSETQEEEVERVVSKYIATGKRIDQDTQGHRPPLYRLRGYSIDGEYFVLRLGRTEFGEYLATNVEHPEWRETYGDIVMSDALALSAATVTGDNLLLWGKRSGIPADTSAPYHILPSGHAHPPDSIGTWVYQELEAETGIKVSEVRKLICTGLMLSLWNTKPELSFFIRASVEFSELQNRDRQEGWEFVEVYGLPFVSSSISKWLVEYRDRVVPPGHAAVLLAARLEFGDKWYNEIVARLREDEKLRG